VFFEDPNNWFIISKAPQLNLTRKTSEGGLSLKPERAFTSDPSFMKIKIITDNLRSGARGAIFHVKKQVRIDIFGEFIQMEEVKISKLTEINRNNFLLDIFMQRMVKTCSSKSPIPSLKMESGSSLMNSDQRMETYVKSIYRSRESLKKTDLLIRKIVQGWQIMTLEIKILNCLIKTFEKNKWHSFYLALSGSALSGDQEMSIFNYFLY